MMSDSLIKAVDDYKATKSDKTFSIILESITDQNSGESNAEDITGDLEDCVYNFIWFRKII